MFVFGVKYAPKDIAALSGRDQVRVCVRMYTTLPIEGQGKIEVMAGAWGLHSSLLLAITLGVLYALMEVKQQQLLRPPRVCHLG